MPRRPWRIGHLLPACAVGGVPHVLAIAALGVVALQHPQPSVKHSYLVVLARMPRRVFHVQLPVHAISTAPHFVIKIAFLRRRRVIRAAAQQPDTTIQDGTAANHPSRRPAWLLRLHLRPFHAVGRVPQISVKLLLRSRECRHCLSAKNPQLVVQNERVMQYPRAPRHVGIHSRPFFTIRRVPYVVLVMPLIRVAANNPHLVFEHRVTRRVPPLPVTGPVELPVEMSIGFHQRPDATVARTPHLVVADAWEMFLVARIPPAQQPHAPLERQCPSPITRRECRLVRHFHPLILRRFK